MWAVFAVLALCLFVKVSDPAAVEQIRLMGFDAKITSLPKQKSSDVVILNIGEGTLKEKGQYPFPRGHYANVLQELETAQAGVVAFTILFPEADRFGQDKYLTPWLQEPTAAVLAQKAANVDGPKGRYIGLGTSGNGNACDFVDAYPGIVTNIPEFDNAVRGLGMVNASTSVDGLTRRMPLAVQVVGDGDCAPRLFPTMPLEIIRSISNTKGFTVKVDRDLGIDSFYIHPREFKTNSDGSVWINWNKTFDEYEWGVDTLPNLERKHVIIGLTAAGLANLVPTPAGQMYPHYVQAQIVETLLQQEYQEGRDPLGYISRPDWAPFLEIGLILIGSMALILAVYYLGLVVSFFVSAVAGLVAYGVSYYFWSSASVLLDWTFGTIVFIIIALHAYGSNFFIQYKLREQIKGQFGTYLSPDMVNMLAKDPSLLKLGGERKEMSFLFMDIVGFTPISEFYKNKDDPEGLVELVNEFLDAMTTIILNNGGTIDKYMGDCIMAFWNAPLPCDNHAEMAVKSAIEIENKTYELKEVYKQRGLPDINVGTGVNTGDCIVGNMGSVSRFDYSVIGDAVNLAARLEATAARHEYLEYKTIISSFTKDQLPFKYPTKHIGYIKVKGKEELISIYSPSEALHK